MAKKFNPAPADKHAADTKQAQKANKDNPLCARRIDAVQKQLRKIYVLRD